VGPLWLSSLSPCKQVLHFFEEERTSENAIFQSLKKETIGSTSEASAKASIAYGKRCTGVMTRSMTKVAAFIIPKQQVVTPNLQPHKTQKFSSNLPADRVNQIAFLPNLKLKPWLSLIWGRLYTVNWMNFTPVAIMSSNLSMKRMMTTVIAILYQHLKGIHFSHKLKSNP